MRKAISIQREEAVGASCLAGEYFIKKMFRLYGKNGVVKLTKTKLLKLVNEFEDHKQKSRRFDICGIALSIHLRCFFDGLLDEVERKPRLKRYSSEDWLNRQYGSDKQIIGAFWKELNRVAL